MPHGTELTQNIEVRKWINKEMRKKSKRKKGTFSTGSPLNWQSERKRFKKNIVNREKKNKAIKNGFWDPLNEVKPKLFGTNYIESKFYRDVDDDRSK